MQFLFPGFLWALLVLAIPVIIHFFNFHRYKTVYFSNVSFLQQIRRESRSRSELRNWLILLLRLLALTFLVFTFARPYLPVDNLKSVSSVQPRVAVYIDNSFSMDAQGKYGALLEWGKLRARELTGAFPPSTLYLLTTNEFSANQQRWVNRDQFIEWLSSIQSTHLVPSLGDVLKHQQIALPDSSQVLYSFLLSDFQKTSFNINSSHPVNGQQIFLMPLQSGLKNNISIDSVWFTSPGLYPGKLEEMKIRLSNHGPDPVSESVLQFNLNDSLKSSVAFAIEAFSKTEVTCNFTQSKSGLNHGKVEIADYPITFDNQLYFSYDIHPIIKILNISQTKGIDYFNALFENDKAVQYQSVNPMQVPYDKLGNYQLIILNQLDIISSGLADALVRFVANGGHLVLIAAPAQVDNSLNQLLKTTLGPVIGNWIVQDGVISELNYQHPFFKMAIIRDAQNPQLPDYKGFYKLNIGNRQRGQVLFKSEAGEPLFFEYPYEDGKIFISALPCNDAWSNLMSHPLLVPLFYNMAMQSTTSPRLFYTIKPQLIVDCNDSKRSEGIISIKNTDGRRLFPYNRVINNRLVLYPEVADLTAGAWTILSDDVEQNTVSFNFDRRESDPGCLTPDEVVDKFKLQGFTKVFLTDASKKMITKEIVQQSRGNDLWQIFLVLALMMLVGEMVVLKIMR